MRIPGSGRINKAINMKRAEVVKKIFISNFSAPVVLNEKKINIPVELVSFSSKGTYYDQLLSILSFVKNVGTPLSWKIFSDGSYESEHTRGLKAFSFVEVIEDAKLPSPLDQRNASWQEKKFYYFASVDIKQTTILLDSDILFFEGFSENILKAVKRKNWYLPYFEPQFDAYFLDKSKDYYHQMNYTNSGFFVLNENIDWSKGKAYLAELKEKNIPLTHFSEQTAMEIVFKDNQMRFLDQNRFCLSMEDHFTLNSKIDHAELAIRHFVGPIRFRMWLVAKQFGFFS